MSENERSKDGGGDDEEVIHREGPKKQRGYGRELRKAKHVVLFPFRKVNKLYRRKNSSASPGKGGGCYPSFMQPLNSDSSVRSQTSDPNNPEFTYEFLKAVIENNHFYSKECNVHIDIS